MAKPRRAGWGGVPGPAGGGVGGVLGGCSSGGLGFSLGGLARLERLVRGDVTVCPEGNGGGLGLAVQGLRWRTEAAASVNTSSAGVSGRGGGLLEGYSSGGLGFTI